MKIVFNVAELLKSGCLNYANTATHIGSHIIDLDKAVRCLKLDCPFGAQELTDLAAFAGHSIWVIEESKNPMRLETERIKFVRFLVAINREIKERTLAAA